MFEKVNPSHPDKVADRIAGAIVDFAYLHHDNPHVAVEVLFGHGKGLVIVETDVVIPRNIVMKICHRLAEPNIDWCIKVVGQDVHLNDNQLANIKCGDNGVFKGVYVSHEQKILTNLAYEIYDEFKSDGKYLLDADKLIICQSNCNKDIKIDNFKCICNPLGFWTGGSNVDSGATNRKLGSDMGDAITGGGLHGKDLSKADVTINIMCHLLAQKYVTKVYAHCAIGDAEVIFIFQDGSARLYRYADCVREAYRYINDLGGFEKFAEWGLIRPENSSAADESPMRDRGSYQLSHKQDKVMVNGLNAFAKISKTNKGDATR